MFIRLLPLIAIAEFFVLGVVLRAVIQFIRHGNTGIVVFRSSSFLRESLRVGACLTFFLAAGIQAALFAFAPTSHGLVAHSTGANLDFGGRIYRRHTRHGVHACGAVRPWRFVANRHR